MIKKTTLKISKSIRRGNVGVCPRAHAAAKDFFDALYSVHELKRQFGSFDARWTSDRLASSFFRRFDQNGEWASVAFHGADAVNGFMEVIDEKGWQGVVLTITFYSGGHINRGAMIVYFSEETGLALERTFVT